MKQLVSAEVIRQEHAAGRNRIEVSRDGFIVTPEARSVAEELGVNIVCRDEGGPGCDCGSVQAKKVDTVGLSDLEQIRRAVLARIPAGSVPPDVIDQLVRKVAAETGAVAVQCAQTAPQPDAGVPSYTSSTIARGIKLVKGNTVKMGIFEGAGIENNVGVADVVTAEDGSAIAAGFMCWDKCFFPWTLTYDEVDLVTEGELHIRCEGQTVVGKVGDVIFIPKGSSIEFGTPSHVRFLYVAYPANWTEC